MGIKLDEAIKRYKNNAEYERTHGNLQGCLEFRQHAEWLEELMQLREQTRWIPVSERLPKAFEFVNCTCHSLIDDREDWVIETVYVPQLSGSPYSDWGNIPMLNIGDCEVVAWMHRDIPEPYKAESENCTPREAVDANPRERIEQMKNEFIHIGEGSGWLDISLRHCLEIIDKYTKG